MCTKDRAEARLVVESLLDQEDQANLMYIYSHIMVFLV